MKAIFECIVKFRSERNWEIFHTPENLAKSISIEASKLLELFQWNNDFRLGDLKNELAYVLIYSFFLAHDLGLDIEKIINDKIKLNETKYPISRFCGKCDKHNK